MLGKPESLARLRDQALTGRHENAACARFAPVSGHLNGEWRAILQCTLGWATQPKQRLSGGLTRQPPAAVRRGRMRPGDAHLEGSTMDAKTGANTKSGTLTVGNQNWSFPIYEGTIGPVGHRHLASSTARPGCSPTTPASPRPAAASPRSPISTATKASCSIAAIRSSSSPSTATSWRPAISCSTASCRPPQQKADFDYRVTRHTMVHEQMSRFFQGFRRDAHPMAVMTGCVGALSAFYHDSTDISDPHQRMVASIRMIAKMPTLAAMAYKYSIGQPFIYPEERARLRHQLPAHVLRGAVRGLQAQPGAGARHGPHLHPARRPRAERLDLDGAARRLRRAPIRSPASRPAAPACGARRMAAPTKRRSRCSPRSARSTASPNTSSAPRTRTTPSA